MAPPIPSYEYKGPRMLGYVIIREDGWFVAWPGSDKSYAQHLDHARVFRSHREASAQCCMDNERVAVLQEMGGRLQVV